MCVCVFVRLSVFMFFFHTNTLTLSLSLSLCPQPPNGKKEKPTRDSVYEMSFMGDSALRGIVCGITRILSGNEYTGPCNNVICGGGGQYIHPLSAGNALGHPFSVPYLDGLLKMTFTYVTTFWYQHFDWMLEWEVRVYMCPYMSYMYVYICAYVCLCVSPLTNPSLSLTYIYI